MLTTIKGYYEGGQIFLSETPPVTDRSEVIITFLSEEQSEKPKKRKLGGLRGLGTLPDDFDEPLDDSKEYM